MKWLFEGFRLIWRFKSQELGTRWHPPEREALVVLRTSRFLSTLPPYDWGSPGLHEQRGAVLVDGDPRHPLRHAVHHPPSLGAFRTASVEEPRRLAPLGGVDRGVGEAGRRRGRDNAG
jgi:hypothetical protein